MGKEKKRRKGRGGRREEKRRKERRRKERRREKCMRHLVETMLAVHFTLDDGLKLKMAMKGGLGGGGH